MRTIKEIIIHCSATKAGRDFRMKDIERWHRDRGFSDRGGTTCGYHYVIDLDGHIEIGKPIETKGTHCKGHNDHSVGICYIGGLDTRGTPTNTMTTEQQDALFALGRFLHQCFPEAKIYGHRAFAARDCPCFDVRDYFPPEWCG